MAVSELPGNPNAVWTVRRHVEGMQYFPKTQGGTDDFWCVLFVGGDFFLFVGFCFLFFLLSRESGKMLHDGCMPSLKVMF